MLRQAALPPTARLPTSHSDPTDPTPGPTIATPARGPVPETSSLLASLRIHKRTFEYRIPYSERVDREDFLAGFQEAFDSNSGVLRLFEQDGFRHSPLLKNAEGVAKRNQKCPQCVMKLQPPAAALDVPDVEELGEGGTLDPDKFGSKIRELVQYLRRELEDDPAHRFLVFIQWSDLAYLVTQVLNTFGIVTARLKNGFVHRETALRRFRSGLELGEENAVGGREGEGGGVDEDADDVEAVAADVKGKRKARVVGAAAEEKSRKEKSARVLMLSAKDSVSGLNLTEATHCIILHPFHDSKEAHAIAAKKQGVARTLRNCQTKTVKIVRFVVENTNEQEMHERRVATLTLNDVV
ncbi:hypothetical protein HDU98_002438 [Podochytrium sp. JEL0797]|nr:hypothetical protein HDU98_002438 [Podochytrium sp. JEL0797]